MIVVLMLSGNHYLYVVEPDWEFIKEQDGIRLYRRDVPGTEIDEFKGETVMSARIEVIGMALRDVLPIVNILSLLPSPKY